MSEQEAREATEIMLDALRYRWLKKTLHSAVGAGITVNDEALVYEDPDPDGVVRLYWYPVTPVGFYESKANTLDEAIDQAMEGQS